MRYGLIFFLGIWLAAAGARASEIVATVNDAPISAFDVQGRARLMQLQQNPSHEVRITRRDLEEALEALVNDQIKLQQAAGEGISLGQAEIDAAVAHLEEQNQMKSGELKKLLKENAIPIGTLEKQVEADLSWLRVMQRRGLSVSVADSAVEERLSQLRQELRKKSFSVAEIIVPDECLARALAQRLHQGEHFAALAKQHSAALSAAAEGKLGWIAPEHYGQEAFAALDKLQPGQLSVPLKIKDGWLLALMMDRKEPIYSDEIPLWELAQIVMPPTNQSFGLQVGRTFKGGCDAFLGQTETERIPGSAQRGLMSPVQLTEELKQVLADAPLRTVAGPVSVPGGRLFFMKCAESSQRVIPTADEVRKSLEMEQLEKSSQRQLQNARRDFLIEYKGRT